MIPLKAKPICLSLLAAALCLFCLAGGASAEEARDLSARCRYVTNAGGVVSNLHDRDLQDPFRTGQKVGASLEVTMPPGAPCQAIAIQWGQMLSPYSVQVEAEGGWRTVYEGDMRFSNDFYALGDAPRFRILTTGDERGRLSIAEMQIFGPGALSGDVQRWEDTPDTADLMLIAAHPDDEFIFMGGTIPYYAVEKGLDVVVVYMTCGSRLRRQELLAGLWAAGYRRYPVIADFPDRFCRGLKEGLALWDERAAVGYLADLFRAYRPQVVVTHDLGGEYNHGNHCATAHCATRALEEAAGGAERPAWQVRKLYLHLYPENAIDIDWTAPLPAFGGQSALDMASAGFAKHASQRGGYAQVNGQTFAFGVHEGGLLSNSAFGLYFSDVGPDLLKNDFMENIQ